MMYADSEDGAQSGSDVSSTGSSVDGKRTLGRNYLVSLQLRIVYYAVAVMLGIISLALGACMHGFCSVRYSFATGADYAAAFLGVPMVFMLMSMLADQVFDIAWDVTQTPKQPLLLFRSMCTTLGMPLLLVDILLILVLEGIPLVVCLIQGFRNGFSLLVMVTEYLRTGMLVCCWLAALLVVLKIAVYAGSKWTAVKHLQERLSHQTIFDDFQPDLGWRQLARESSMNEDTMVDGKVDWRRGVCYFAAALVALICGWLWLDLTRMVGLTFILLLAVLFFIWLGFSYTVPLLLGHTYLVMLSLYALISFTTLWFDLSEIEGEDNTVFMVPGAPNASIASGDAVVPRYPICSMRWGGGFCSQDSQVSMQLNVFDFLTMAQAVYARDRAHVIATMANATLNTALADYVLEDIQPHEALARYAIFRFDTAKKRVMAIRGTQNQDEVMADADLLSSVAIVTAMSNILPIDNLIPERPLREHFERMDMYRVWSRKTPYQPHIDKAMELKRQSEEQGYELFITGHSLGGLFAAITGGHAGVQSVAFSPPGQDMMLLRYGLQNNIQITSTLTSVVPALDLVPKVDKQLGPMQPINCAAKSSLSCHMMGVTACELFENCGGDPRGRVLSDEVTQWCRSLRA